MINPATQPSDQLNTFTETVRNMLTDNLYGQENYAVKLRNDTLVRPVFKVAEDETCSDAFFTEDYKYCWNLDGTSVTRSDFDMMEIVRAELFDEIADTLEKMYFKETQV